MQKIIAIFLILLISANCLQQQDKPYYQHLEQIGKEVNQKGSTWQAKENLDELKDLTKDEAISMNGGKSYFKKYLSDSKIVDDLENPPFYEPLSQSGNIPENFDAREQWSKCSSLKEIRNQSKCGSCWSFGGAEAFTDRWCIASGEQDTDVRFSTENLVSCCDFCGNGCGGGYNPMVWNYFQNTGIVTGNNYGDKNYCQSYSIAPDTKSSHQTPKCRYQCDSTYSAESYGDDLYYTNSTGLIINKNLTAIQEEIMTNGPVEVLFYVFEDFYSYKGGVYQHVTGDDLGGHAVKMLGWGVENGTPYWLCANSWGTGFGEKGFFKILRGADECGIEHEITYGQPDIERRQKSQEKLYHITE